MSICASLLPSRFSLLSLLAALFLTTRLPVAHLGSGYARPPDTLAAPQENALSSPLRAHSFSLPHAAFALESHVALRRTLCALPPSSTATPPPATTAAAWLLSALRAEGLAAEALRGAAPYLGVGGAVVSAVLHAGSGGSGTSALLIASPLPADAAALGGCGNGDAPPATPHGALLLLALARALNGAPWRAADITLVFYYDGREGTAGAPCGDSGALGQAGCYERRGGNSSGASQRGARVSAGLAAWARAHNFDALAEAEASSGRSGCIKGGARTTAAAAWRALALQDWAAAITSDLPHALLLPPPLPPHLRRPSNATPLLLSSNATPPLCAPLLQPLRHAAGPVRAALVLQLPGSQHEAPPEAWETSTQGANGRQADTDLLAAVRRCFGNAALGVGVGLGAGSGGREKKRSALASFAASAWALAWGPTGGHGELLEAGIPALSISPSGGGAGRRGVSGGGGASIAAVPATSLLPLGRSLECTLRSLNGLDEALHAGAQGYVLLPATLSPLGAHLHLIPLPEYAIPIALLHLPVLLLLLLPPAPPAAGAILRGACALAASAAFGFAAYAALMHGGLGEAVHDGVAAVLQSLPAGVREAAHPAACGGGHLHAYLSWAWAVAVCEVALAAALRKGVAACRAGGLQQPPFLLAGGEAGGEAPSAAWRAPPGPVALGLLLQGCAFFPLMYFNAPLVWAESVAAVGLLVGAAAVAAARPALSKALGPRGAAAVPSLLWLLTSPLHALLILAARSSGGVCSLAEGLQAAAGLHATYGAHHAPLLLLLLLPLHSALAAA